MDTNTKENGTEMALFSRSPLATARKDKDATHNAWHCGSLLKGRRRGLFDDSMGKLDAKRAELTAAENEPSDPETGEFRDTTALRDEIARGDLVKTPSDRVLQPARTRRRAGIDQHREYDLHHDACHLVARGLSGLNRLVTTAHRHPFPRQRSNGPVWHAYLSMLFPRRSRAHQRR